MRVLPLSLLLLLSITTASPAQWRLAAIGGWAAAHGDARDNTDPAHPEIRADRPATFALALSHDNGAWRIGGEMRWHSADLAEVDGGSSISTRNVLSAWGVSGDIGRRVAGRSGAATLHAIVGAGIDRWSFDLAEDLPRWRVTARAALEAGLPVTSRWSAIVRGEMTAGPSLFEASELPEGFSTRTAARVGVALGIARRF